MKNSENCSNAFSLGKHVTYLIWWYNNEPTVQKAIYSVYSDKVLVNQQTDNSPDESIHVYKLQTTATVGNLN